MSRVAGWRTIGLLILVGFVAGCSRSPADGGDVGQHVELLNVSYDPTRELWKELNSAFRGAYKLKTGIDVSIKTSHAGSSNQARAVIDGLDADVVTLAMWQDTDAIRKKGLINDGKAGWEQRLPERSLPYISTIVFVVRKGNPKGVKDWSDLVQGDIEIITPNPKTSGNGKLSFLAAWGYVIRKGGSGSRSSRIRPQHLRARTGPRQYATASRPVISNQYGLNFFATSMTVIIRLTKMISARKLIK